MHKRWRMGLALMGLGILAVMLWLVLQPEPPPSGVLAVNGRIEGDQAAVGAKMSGKIVRLPVREGDQVEAGALIAALASEQAQAQLEQAQHVLHTTQEQLAQARTRVAVARSQVDAAETAVTLTEREPQARIGEAQAALEAARARLRQAEAELEKAANDYARYQELFAKRVIPAQQLDAAKAASTGAQATVEAARKHVTQAEKALDLAQASRVTVDLRRQEVETARGQ